MKTEIKKGDRIAIYGFDSEDALTVRKRMVSGVAINGLIETDAGEFVHHKQCRILKPKTRRTVWIKAKLLDDLFAGMDGFHMGMSVFRLHPDPASFGDTVEFIQVVRK